MKSLVLGGNGFIGGHLIEAGDAVTIYDRAPARFRAVTGRI